MKITRTKYNKLAESEAGYKYGIVEPVNEHGWSEYSDYNRDGINDYDEISDEDLDDKDNIIEPFTNDEIGSISEYDQKIVYTRLNNIFKNPGTQLMKKGAKACAFLIYILIKWPQAPSTQKIPYDDKKLNSLLIRFIKSVHLNDNVNLRIAIAVCIQYFNDYMIYVKQAFCDPEFLKYKRIPKH
jgi:hypothetical protein